MTNCTCTCTKCGWVSFAVTRAYAEEEVKRFNDYYAALPEQEKEFWRGVNADGTLRPHRAATIDDYTCQLCGGSVFREAKEGDCPDGVTIGPVIWEDRE